MKSGHCSVVSEESNSGSRGPVRSKQSGSLKKTSILSQSSGNIGEMPLFMIMLRDLILRMTGIIQRGNNTMADWIVVCAHCGKPMKINGLTQHFRNQHNWRTLADDSLDTRSNPFWKTGGI